MLKILHRSGQIELHTDELDLSEWHAATILRIQKVIFNVCFRIGLNLMLIAYLRFVTSRLLWDIVHVSPD